MSDDEWPSAQAISHKKTVPPQEIEILRADGKRVTITDSAAPLVDSNGNATGAVVVIQDITDRKLAEEQLKLALQTRDDFLSIASRELKTPLTSLSLQIQILNRIIRRNTEDAERRGDLADTVPIPREAAEGFSSIERQSKRLSNLLDELLDLTRIRVGRINLERESTDLRKIVNDAVERFRAEADEKGVSISVHYGPSTVGHWDPMRLEQVATNLISNALKYGRGSPVVVRVESDSVSRKARLIVQGQGMGIAPEMIDKIFERFERAGVRGQKIAGLGLGLYLTRQIVEAHGGTIRVESEVDRGSKFVVELPF